MGKELTILDRVILPSILKKEGNYVSMILNKDIKKKTELTQDELVKFKFRTLSNGNVAWELPEDTKDAFDVEFTESEKAEITSCLSKMEQENKLTEDHIHLYELFLK